MGSNSNLEKDFLGEIMTTVSLRLKRKRTSQVVTNEKWDSQQLRW